jgi:hypothetical protein
LARPHHRPRRRDRHNSGSPRKTRARGALTERFGWDRRVVLADPT